jgi:hypothetical protein
LPNLKHAHAQRIIFHFIFDFLLYFFKANRMQT